MYAENQGSKASSGRISKAWLRFLRSIPHRKKAQSCPELQSHHGATEISVPRNSDVVDDTPLLSLEDLPPVQTSPRKAPERRERSVDATEERNCSGFGKDSKATKVVQFVSASDQDSEAVKDIGTIPAAESVVQPSVAPGAKTNPGDDAVKLSSRQTTYLPNPDHIEDTIDLAMWQWHRAMALGNDPRADEKKKRKDRQEKRKQTSATERAKKAVVKNDSCAKEPSSPDAWWKAKENPVKEFAQPEQSSSNVVANFEALRTKAQLEAPPVKAHVEAPPTKATTTKREISFDVNVHCCNIGEFSVVKEQAAEDVKRIAGPQPMPMDPPVDAPGLWIKKLSIRPVSLDSVDELCNRHCNKWCRVGF